MEALASAVACHVLKYTKDPDNKVTVKLSKPNAFPLAASALVQLTRRQDDFPNDFAHREFQDHLPTLPESSHLDVEVVNKGTSSSSHSVALALGSNLGDRFANIETALRLLEMPISLLSDLAKDAQVSVVDTSFMYETAPMYVADQPRFANCACMVRLWPDVRFSVSMFIAVRDLGLDRNKPVSQGAATPGQGNRDGGWQSAERASRPACGRSRHSNV